MRDHIEAFIGTITNDIAKYGYLAIVFGMFIENAGMPVPSEPMLLFAGYLVHLGKLNLAGALGSAILGSLLGGLVMYWIGAAGGRALILRYGRFVHLTPKALERTEAWFNRFGRGAVSLARIIPIIRTWISMPAGIARMPLPYFVAFTTLGVLPWCLALLTIGYGLGARWEVFESRIWSFDVLAVALPLVAVAALALILRARSRANQEKSRPER
ncbi:MAG TPA: DedA family protein [Bacillota bacterium]